MKILSYSPKVEVYIEAFGRYSSTTYDVSEDVVSGSVSRNVDAPSTFSLKLQNPQRKYNGVFTPMDRIAVYLTKTERQCVLTGYLTDVDVFTLYEQDMEISGSCSLYRMQKTYWDPGLFESRRLFSDQYSGSKEWDDFTSVIYRLVHNVGGWDDGKILIGEIPQEILDFARELFEAKKAEYAQAIDMADEFYEVLRTSGPQVVSGSQSSSGGVSAGVGQASSEGLERAVQWAISIANDNSHGYSMPNRMGNPDYDCSSLVYYALIQGGWSPEQLGGTYPFTTYTMDVLNGCGFTKVSYNGDPSSLERGDILWNSGHTAIAIGGGQLVEASWDYDGVAGDSSGKEVHTGNVYSDFTHYYRFTR